MESDPKNILKKYWGFSEYKASQEAIISSILAQKDVLALLPTGGGKSLCFQLPALAKEGLCIVVSPLIALIKNQVDNLKTKGIKAIALTGQIAQEEMIDILDNCLYGNYKFLYLSPERLQQDIIKDRILQMNINLIAIDEAHCISQWGNDFRPAYLNCGILRDLAPNAPIIALTATATTTVAKEIIDNLQFKEYHIEKASFARDNITFSVQFNEDKAYQLAQVLLQTKKSGIVYVRTRKNSIEISNLLNSKGIKATFYHGGLSKKEKDSRLDTWLHNQTQIMVATNAFGMGIDKPDVEVVVHYQIPETIENYFQEAGRAGRDGAPAKAILITNNADENVLKGQFLSGLPTIAFLKQLYNKLNNYFQISYGSFSQEIYSLNFNAFCAAYKLNSFLTYNGLRMLDQNSVLALSESFSEKTSIQFIASKNQVFDYLETYTKSAEVIQTILRTYGGIFEYETKINTHAIAKKVNLPEAFIIRMLQQLEKDKIITYKAQHNDLEITFLVPREDDSTIHLFAKKAELLIAQKTKNMESMLAYVKNNSICRSQYLLKYFGERREKCGKCDICLKKNPIAASVIDLVKETIVTQLKKTPLTSRAIIKEVLYKEELIIEAIQELLEEEIIEINTKNEYKLII